MRSGKLSPKLIMISVLIQRDSRERSLSRHGARTQQEGGHLQASKRALTKNRHLRPYLLSLQNRKREMSIIKVPRSVMLLQ